MYKNLLFILIIFSSFLIFSACGNGGDPAPAGSTMTISPPEVTIGALSGPTYQNFSVVVLNANNVPLNDVDLTISGSFAEPRLPSRYRFYRGKDGSDGAVTSSFTATTDEEGVYVFSIWMFDEVDGSANAFLDNIEVRSVTLFSSVAVSLNQTVATP